MGTEFQYAINPLAANRKIQDLALDDWDYLKQQKREKRINFEDSMDKLIERENVEFIKRAMVTHENIFKHQVRELHRVYNTQKILTEETRNKAHHAGHFNENRTPMTKGFNLRTLAGENGQLSAQSSRIPRPSVTEGSNIFSTRVHNPSTYTCDKDDDGYEECDIDLTLGIGGKKKQMKTEGSSSSSSTNNHNQNNLPHWLYKSLGCNKT